MTTPRNQRTLQFSSSKQQDVHITSLAAPSSNANGTINRAGSLKRSPSRAAWEHQPRHRIIPLLPLPPADDLVYDGRQAPSCLLPSNQVEETVFNLIFCLQHDNDLPRWVYWVLVALMDWQYYSFVFNPDILLDLPLPISIALDPTRALLDFSHLSATTIAAFLLVVGVLLALTTASVILKRKGILAPHVKQGLKLTTLAVMLPLSIPLLTVFMTGLQCVDLRLLRYPAEQCFSRAHLPVFVLDILGIVLLCIGLLLGSALFIETSPTSVSPLARPHGRVEAMDALLRIALVLLKVVTLPKSGSDNIMLANLALIFVGSSYLTALTAHSQPYFHAYMSSWKTGTYISLALGSLATLIIRLTVGGNTNTWWLAILIAPLIGYSIGCPLSLQIHRGFLHRHIRKWHRAVKHQVRGQTTIKPSPSPSTSLADTASPQPPPLGSPGLRASLSTAAADPTQTSSAGRAVGLLVNELDLRSLSRKDRAGTGLDPEQMVGNILAGSSTDALNDVHVTVGTTQNLHVFWSPLQLEVCLRLIRSNPIHKHLTLGLELLNLALHQFKHNAFTTLQAHIYLSTYYGRDGTHVAQSLCKSLEDSLARIPIDVKYICYAHARASAVGSSKPAPVGATSPAALEGECRYHHRQALFAIQEVWEVVHSGGSAHQLAEAVASMARHRDLAEQAYRSVLTRGAGNRRAASDYARFLEGVCAERERAKGVLGGLSGGGHSQDDIGSSLDGLKESEGQLGVEATQAAIKATALLTEEVNVQHLQAGSRGNDEDRVNFGVAPSGLMTDTLPRLDNERVPSYPSQASSRPKASMASINSSSGGRDTATSQPAAPIKPISERLKVQMRSLLVDRLAGPLKGVWFGNALILFYISVLIAGFVLGLEFKAGSSRVLGTEFSAARNGRKSAQAVIEYVRQMVHANVLGSQPALSVAHGKLSSEVAALIDQYLPAVNSMADSGEMSHFTLFSRIEGNSSWVDFNPLTLSAPSMVNNIAQAGALALGYPTLGGLTPAVFANTTEFRIMLDNLELIHEAMLVLPSTAVEAFTASVLGKSTTLSILMSVVLVSLVLVALYLLTQVFHKFFCLELKAIRLLLALPKRHAATLLANTEVHLERFGKQAGDKSGTSNHTRGAQRPQETGALSTRQKRYYGGLIFVFVAMFSLSVGVLEMSRGAIDMSADMERMVQSANRRFHVNIVRLLGREFASSDTSIPNDFVIRMVRNALFDLKVTHEELLHDPEGITAQLPELTTLPRDCREPSNCPRIAEELGLTASVASMPLNTEIGRFLDLSSKVVGSFTEQGAKNTFNASAAYARWKLVEAISLDLNHRLTQVDDAYQLLLRNRVGEATSTAIALFAILIAVGTGAAIAYMGYAVRTLRQDASALVAVMYMVPSHVFKEVPELGRLLNTGGMSLRSSSSDDP